MSRHRGESGSVAVFAGSLIGMLVAFTLACAGVAGLLVAHRQAQSAADLAALGAATALQRRAAPCPVAADVVHRNAGRLVRCRVRGETVTIEVEVSTSHVLSSLPGTRAKARAGPVYSGEIGLVPR